MASKIDQAKVHNLSYQKFGLRMYQNSVPSLFFLSKHITHFRVCAERYLRNFGDLVNFSLSHEGASREIYFHTITCRTSSVFGREKYRRTCRYTNKYSDLLTARFCIFFSMMDRHITLRSRPKWSIGQWHLTRCGRGFWEFSVFQNAQRSAVNLFDFSACLCGWKVPVYCGGCDVLH